MVGGHQPALGIEETLRAEVVRRLPRGRVPPARPLVREDLAAKLKDQNYSGGSRPNDCASAEKRHFMLQTFRLKHKEKFFRWNQEKKSHFDLFLE